MSTASVQNVVAWISRMSAQGAEDLTPSALESRAQRELGEPFCRAGSWRIVAHQVFARHVQSLELKHAERRAKLILDAEREQVNGTTAI